MTITGSVKVTTLYFFLFRKLIFARHAKKFDTANIYMKQRQMKITHRKSNFERNETISTNTVNAFPAFG